MMKKILFGLIAVATLFSSPNEAPVSPKIGLLSYPRSGSKWFMYVLLFGAERNWKINHQLWKHFQTEIDYSKIILDHSHHKKVFARHFQPERDKLIVLVRNYRECIIRRHGAAKIAQIISSIKNQNFEKLNTNWYFDQLAFFDEWPEENRLLVYYEDMILRPREVFEEVVAFIGDDPVILEDFFASYKEHVAKSLAWRSAKEKTMRPVSKGKDLSYHSKRISEKEIYAFDEAVKKSYPDLWEKYLTRYEKFPQQL
ncbi:MAG: sulfotransferase domain-containing protein [Candidatus Algichlamydia australiensis]|nr:sulfotransferase domain-containing protein [Chlamydiales bacterium]